jgi:hypothetical protein
MEYLTAEKQASQFYFKILIDEVQPETPENVREYQWCLTPPDGQTETVYLTNIKNEITLLVEDELKRMTPPPAPTPLAGF